METVSPGDRNPSYVTLDKFDKTYFSGLDSSIYFGDLFISELISLEYQVQELVEPLFGYNSFIRDRVARGRRIITGQFVVNFQQVWLMYKILDYVSNRLSWSQTVQDVAQVSPSTANKLKTLGPTSKGTSTTATVSAKSSPTVKGLLGSAAAAISTAGSLAGNPQAQKQVEALWPTVAGTLGKAGGSSLLNDVRIALRGYFPRWFTSSDGFDINVVFGDYNPDNNSQSSAVVGNFLSGSEAMPSTLAQQSAAAVKQLSGTQGLDAMLTKAPPYTTRKLIGVELTGMAQIVDDSGRPILESFSFLAADFI